MEELSFYKAATAFSDVLGQIPQDNLPTDFLVEVNGMLTYLRSKPESYMFGMRPGEPVMPRRNNLSIGAMEVWMDEWDRQHPEKAMFANAAVSPETDDKDVENLIKFQRERDIFVVGQMKSFLGRLHKKVPDEIIGYLEGPRGGPKEGEW